MRCVFYATNRDKSAVWAFFDKVGYDLRVIYLRETGRNFALQILLLIASVRSLTAKEKPRQNALRSPRLINSVWLSLIFSSIIFCCSLNVADNSCSWRIGLSGDLIYPYDKDRAFLLQQFKKCDEVTCLSDKQSDSFQSNRKTFVIEKESARKITDYINAKGISAFMLFTAALATYINRVKMNTERFYIGTAVLNRSSFAEKNTIPRLRQRPWRQDGGKPCGGGNDKENLPPFPWGHDALRHQPPAWVGRRPQSLPQAEMERHHGQAYTFQRKIQRRRPFAS